MPFPNPASVKLGSIRKAICGESLDGWLFCNFRHRDKLSPDHPPIVAAGANAGNPHYDFEGGGVG